MRSKTAALAGVFGAGLALVFTVGAAGESTPALDFELGFGTSQVASPTALSLHTIYKNPSDPNGKPSPLRKSVVEAPAGTVFNGRAVPACTASDNELLAGGAGACPPGSHVGTGTVTLLTGFGPPVDPFAIDAALFNAGDGIIELFSEHRTGLRIAVGHAKFTAPDTLTEMPAPEPGGPPDGESAVHEVDFHFNQVRGPDGAAFITTPGTCPASGMWTSKLTATVADGHVYTATSTTPCSAGPMSTARETASPAISIRVIPRHVTAGARVRFHVRLYAPTVDCIRGATVKLNHVRAYTDRRGHVVIVTRLSRSGGYPLTAAHGACQPGHAIVTALAAGNRRRGVSRRR